MFTSPPKGGNWEDYFYYIFAVLLLESNSRELILFQEPESLCIGSNQAIRLLAFDPPTWWLTSSFFALLLFSYCTYEGKKMTRFPFIPVRVQSEEQN